MVVVVWFDISGGVKVRMVGYGGNLAEKLICCCIEFW